MLKWSKRVSLRSVSSTNYPTLHHPLLSTFLFFSFPVCNNLDQLGHSVCVVFHRSWDVCGPYMCLGSPITQISTPVEMLTWKAGSFCMCWFDRWWDICGPYKCLGSPITRTSTQVGMSTRQAVSFCLCCFWQVVRHLWSLDVSGIPNHMDLHPGRKVYLTSWLFLSVLFLTGGETSVVPTCVRDPLSHRSPSP